jgi:hypothetical protein
VGNSVKLVKVEIEFLYRGNICPSFPRSLWKLIATIPTNIRVNIFSGKKPFSMDESTMLNMYLIFVVEEKVENVFFNIVATYN